MGVRPVPPLLTDVSAYSKLPLADAVRQHQQITVWVLNKNFLLSGFAIASLTPDFTEFEINRSIFRLELF